MRKPSGPRLLIFMVVLVVAGTSIPERIGVTITPSLRHRIFLLDRSPGKDAMRPDRYILFNLRSAFIKGYKTHKVIKRVACAEGDELLVRERSYFCNDRYLGQAKEYSLKGEKLTHFPFEGTIPEGKLFVFSNHIDSFDSRYFGFVERDDVLAIAHPVF